MIETTGDIWEYSGKRWIIITTNGTIKRDGTCVMGRGIAEQAKDRYPELPKLLGDYIGKFGNKIMPWWNKSLITFPVKHNWWEDADLKLIEKSCQELAEFLGPSPGAMVRPGCGNGGLSWSTVKPILEKYFSDNILIVERGV